MGRPDRIHLSCNRSSPEPLLPPPVLASSRLVTEIPAAESLVLRGGALRHQYSKFLRPPRPRRARRAYAQGVPPQRHPDRPPRERLHLDLCHCRRAPRAHRGFSQPQKAPGLGCRHMDRDDGFRRPRHHLRDTAPFPCRRWGRRSSLRADRDELARRSVSTGPTLSSARAVHARRAGRRRTRFFLQRPDSTGVWLASRNGICGGAGGAVGFLFFFFPPTRSPPPPAGAAAAPALR